MRLEIRLLGGVRAFGDGRMLDVGGPRARSVLAVLLLQPGRVVPREQLVEYAWGIELAGVEELVAACVHRLREATASVDEIRLRSLREGFVAELDPMNVDAHRFLALSDLSGVGHAEWGGESVTRRLRQALEVWQGETAALAHERSDWLRAQAQFLEERRLDVIERLARREFEAGRHGETVALLRRAASEHPDREGLTAILVQALTALGGSALATDAAARTARASLGQGRPFGRVRYAAQAASLLGHHEGGRVDRGPRQLPAGTRSFTGREEELVRLLDLAERAWTRPAPGTVAICAIDGMAGIGKSALAVEAAHRVSDRFPDGQLFVDLHGYTQGLPPRDPLDVLAEVLHTLGVQPGQLPADLDARAALYRACLADSRMLIVLDNAATETQVRPLLPGQGGCLVLVTSRRRLKALDEAQSLSLDLLPLPDAVSLFHQVAGDDRVDLRDPAVQRVARLCGQLPLALRIAAALLRADATWSPERLVDRLSEHLPEEPGLEGFADGDRSLATVFDLSYRALGDEHRVLFRRLGLLPGPDVDPYAAAALHATHPVRAERLLDDLVDHKLLTQPTARRYRMHDLVRVHARTLAASDSEDERDSAQIRLLDYYQHAALRADALVTRVPRPTSGGAAPRHSPELPDGQAARSWLRTERANLDAAFDHARSRGLDSQVVALSAGLAQITYTDGPWTRALGVHAAGAEAARRLSDGLGRAAALTDLGVARRLAGDYPGAADTLVQALEIYRELGDCLGQAAALTDLGIVRQVTGDYPGAAGALTHAVELSRRLGERRGRGTALTYLGIVRQVTGDYPGAMDALTQALESSREFDDRLGQGGALTLLGFVRQVTGDYPGATDALTQALEIFRDLGNRVGQANNLTYLGVVRCLTGDYPGATDALAQALKIYRDRGDRRNQAIALTYLGTVRRLTGDYADAADALTRALEFSRELSDHGQEARAMNHYAALLSATGDRPQALTVYRDALQMSREVNKPDDEAVSLEGIGECHLGVGNIGDGSTHLRQALEIFRRLGMRPDIERIQARLAQPCELHQGSASHTDER